MVGTCILSVYLRVFVFIYDFMHLFASFMVLFASLHIYLRFLNIFATINDTNKGAPKKLANVFSVLLYLS